MSDQMKTLESEAANPAAWDGGGLFQGPDKRISLRRIIATALIVWGGVLESIAQGQSGDLIGRIAPGGVLIVAGLVIIGALTAQSIITGIKAIKGA